MTTTNLAKDEVSNKELGEKGCKHVMTNLTFHKIVKRLLAMICLVSMIDVFLIFVLSV